MGDLPRIVPSQPVAKVLSDACIEVIGIWFALKQIDILHRRFFGLLRLAPRSAPSLVFSPASAAGPAYAFGFGAAAFATAPRRWRPACRAEAAQQRRLVGGEGLEPPTSTV